MLFALFPRLDRLRDGIQSGDRDRISIRMDRLRLDRLRDGIRFPAICHPREHFGLVDPRLLPVTIDDHCRDF